MIETGACRSVTPFFSGRVRILANDLLARSTYRIRLEAPLLARTILPGQFFMVRIPDHSDPLLGRPFALYDTVCGADGGPAAVDFVYLVVGKVTKLLAEARAGDFLECWGPLGNGFSEVATAGHIGLVAGGIGQTPFLAYTRFLRGERGYGGKARRSRPARVSVYYGVRSAALMAGVQDFLDAGATVRMASDDGSVGHCGYVTDLLKSELGPGGPDHLVGCGPEPMLHALMRLAAEKSLPCEVSLETPMACGVGVCFSCVTAVRTPHGLDYKRVCVDGPVFDAASLVLPENTEPRG